MILNYFLVFPLLEVVSFFTFFPLLIALLDFDLDFLSLSSGFSLFFVLSLLLFTGFSFLLVALDFDLLVVFLGFDLDLEETAASSFLPLLLLLLLLLLVDFFTDLSSPFDEDLFFLFLFLFLFEVNPARTSSSP